jgi:glycosyltransferase involved in cell wall biosynthesis
MLKLSVCLLTCNSARLLMEVLPPLLKVADECIVVDSGSTDETSLFVSSLVSPSIIMPIKPTARR